MAVTKETVDSRRKADLLIDVKRIEAEIDRKLTTYSIPPSDSQVTIQLLNMISYDIFNEIKRKYLAVGWKSVGMEDNIQITFTF